MNASGRSMALEAGGAAHEVFAAHRLYSLIQYGPEEYSIDRDKLQSIVDGAGVRIFGATRYGDMVGAINPAEDERTNGINYAITALYNSGFYDDPADKRRTMTNIEEMCIAYMDHFSWKRQLPVILGADSDAPFVGVEIPVDITVEYTLHDGSIKAYRFTGKADGLHYRDLVGSAYRVHENKTASRLGDAWEQSWELNHQPTGYMIGLSTMLGHEVDLALMLGTALPLPKSYSINGVSRVPVQRYPHNFVDWFDWFFYTTQLHDAHVAHPTEAPQFTHSCNRYFRPCSYIPLCALPPDERVETFNDMDIQEWSPLHKAGEQTDE